MALNPDFSPQSLGDKKGSVASSCTHKQVKQHTYCHVLQHFIDYIISQFMLVKYLPIFPSVGNVHTNSFCLPLLYLMWHGPKLRIEGIFTQL
jgi:hypothetical protein